MPRSGIGLNELLDASTGSVGARFGEYVENRYSANYQSHANEGPCVELLSMKEPRNCCDQHDAEARPNSVGNADWNGLQDERQKIESYTVADDNYGRRGKFGESFTRFER